MQPGVLIIMEKSLSYKAYKDTLGQPNLAVERGLGARSVGTARLSDVVVEKEC